jgi:hypothetical protein
MGALSSWAMLAFVHHAFVQWAALRAGVITVGKGWYEGYAILGDDVVIAGSQVAKEYLRIMRSADVGIGDHKSLVSRNGSVFEFAKRTFLHGVNVSMVPFAEFVAGRQSLAGLLELIRKYSLTLGQTLSVLGYGYKAKANASKRLFDMPKRLRNYIVTFYGPSGPAYAGLRGWLPMKSATAIYGTAMDRVSGLVGRFFQAEVKLCLEVLDTWHPLIQEAKRLGTVYRDREHYGTVSRGPDRASWHPGTEISTPHEIIDALNETVYRPAFMDTVIAYRDLRTKLEELQVSSLDWDGLEALWSEIRAIETDLGALPLPSNIFTRTSPASSLVGKESKVLRRWYRHSGTFRATVDPAGNSGE